VVGIEVIIDSDFFCIINAYLPCRGIYSEADYEEILDEIGEIIQKYGPTHHIILMGDMNASLNKEIPNSRDKHFIRFCTENCIYTDVPKENTFFHVNGTDVNQSDYILCTLEDKELLLAYKTVGQTELVSNTSDHVPVMASLESSILKKNPDGCSESSPTQARINWDKVNKSDYGNAVSNTLDPTLGITSNKGLLSHVEKLITSLRVASDSCTHRDRKPKKSKKGLKIWTPAIARAVADSKEAHKTWKCAGSPIDPQHETVQNRKKMKATLRSSIRCHARNLQISNCNKIAAAKTDDTKLFFKLINQQRRGNREVTNDIEYNGQSFSTPEQIAEAFGNYFQTLAQPTVNSEFSQLYKDDAVTNRNLINDISGYATGNLEPITNEEMCNIICSLSSGKAADLHELTAEHLKFGSNRVAEWLVSITNYILQTGCIPAMLKSGTLTPVLKKGKDQTDPSNYRGITVTSIIMKVVEKAWLLRAAPIINEKQNPMQRGFTKASSSMNAALLVSEAINDAADTKKPIHITLLDASKAFDVVDHDILMNELHDVGITGKLWTAFQSMYQDTSSMIKWNKCLSPQFDIKQGVRQGGITSAPSYKVYTNKLLDQLQDQKIGYAIGTNYIPAPTCADDIAIITSDPVEGQVLLNVVHQYSIDHRYMINPSKSATIKNLACDSSKYVFNNNPIPVLTKATHLGIERNPKNEPNVSEMIRMGRRVTYSLMGAGLHGKDGLPPHLAYHLITVYVIPRMLYGVEVIKFNTRNLAQIERFHRKQLRQIQCLPEKPPPANTAVYALLGAKPVEAHIDLSILTLFGNITRQPDSIEYQLAWRQLAVKKDNSKSWFVLVKKVLAKYNLPTSYELIKHPPNKLAWKAIVDKAVGCYWLNQWQLDHVTKSSMKYINIHACRFGKPHHVWSSLPPDVREVEKAAVKARLLTGTYVLQANRAKFNQYTVPNTCLLCSTDAEDEMHFLIKCPKLADQRQYHIKTLRRVLLQHCNDQEVENLLSDERVLLQFILDPSHESVCEHITLPLDWAVIFEPVTRQWCHSLHVTRSCLLKELSL
jgi:hypothetical protein